MYIDQAQRHRAKDLRVLMLAMRGEPAEVDRMLAAAASGDAAAVSDPPVITPEIARANRAALHVRFGSGR